MEVKEMTTTEVTKVEREVTSKCRLPYHPYTPGSLVRDAQENNAAALKLYGKAVMWFVKVQAKKNREGR